jgi:ATP-dependent Clp protease adaptor protein ClpS
MAQDQVALSEKVKSEVQEPKRFKVLFLNDDQTPMEFVIELLVKVLRHSENVARDLTLEIHNSGSAVVGVFSFEIAEQKGLECTQLSRDNGFPLQITVEEE